MIKIISFFIIIMIFNMSNICVAGTLIKNSAEHKEKMVYPIINYHSDPNGIVLKKSEGNDRIEVKLHYYRKNIDNKKDMYNYFIHVKYNNKIKKIKYFGWQGLGALDIINVQMTSDFCNKKYIVISIRIYNYFKGDYRRYMELFLDFNKKNKRYSEFEYDQLGFPTDGPLPLAYIKSITKHKCYKNGIDFIYDKK